MDEQLRRIVDFLKNNKNSYFEAIDVAYHLKLDELYTENALVLLQSRKFVNSSRNPDGKVVWYIANGLNQNRTFTSSASSSTARLDDVTQNTDSEQRSLVDSAKKKQTFWMQIAKIVALILFVSGGIYLGKWYVDKKITSAMADAKTAVPMHEYAVFRGKCIEDNDGLQKNVDVLYSQLENTNKQIDSLKSIVSSVQQQILDLQKTVTRKR